MQYTILFVPFFFISNKVFTFTQPGTVDRHFSCLQMIGKMEWKYYAPPTPKKRFKKINKCSQIIGQDLCHVGITSQLVTSRFGSHANGTDKGNTVVLLRLNYYMGQYLRLRGHRTRWVPQITTPQACVCVWGGVRVSLY